MASRQTAIETLLRKIIASEEDWDPTNPDESRLIEETYQRMTTKSKEFFGD